MPIRINVQVSGQAPAVGKGGAGGYSSFKTATLEVPEGFGFLNNIKINESQFGSAQRTPLNHRGYGLVGIKVMGDLQHPNDVQGASLDYQKYLNKVGGNKLEKMMLHYGQRTGPTKGNWTGIKNPNEQANQANLRDFQQGQSEITGAMIGGALVPPAFKAFGATYGLGVRVIGKVIGEKAAEIAGTTGQVGLGGWWAYGAKEGKGPATIPNAILGNRPAAAPGLLGAIENSFDLVSEAAMGAEVAKAGAGVIKEAGKTGLRWSADILKGFGGKFEAGATTRELGTNPRAFLEKLRAAGIDYQYKGEANEVGLNSIIESLGMAESTKLDMAIMEKALDQLNAGQFAGFEKEAKSDILEKLNQMLSERLVNLGKRKDADRKFPIGKFEDTRVDKSNELNPETQKLAQDILDKQKEEVSGTLAEMLSGKGKSNMEPQAQAQAQMEQAQGKPFAEPENPKQALEEAFKEAEAKQKIEDQKKLQEAIDEAQKKAEAREKKEKARLESEKAKAKSENKDMTPKEVRALKEKIRAEEAVENDNIKEQVKKWKKEGKQKKIEERIKEKEAAKVEKEKELVKAREWNMIPISEWESPSFQSPRGGSLPVAPAFYKSAINVPAFILGSGRLEYADN